MPIRNWLFTHKRGEFRVVIALAPPHSSPAEYRHLLNYLTPNTSAKQADRFCKVRQTHHHTHLSPRRTHEKSIKSPQNSSRKNPVASIRADKSAWLFGSAGMRKIKMTKLRRNFGAAVVGDWAWWEFPRGRLFSACSRTRASRHSALWENKDDWNCGRKEEWRGAGLFEKWPVWRAVRFPGAGRAWAHRPDRRVFCVVHQSLLLVRAITPIAVGWNEPTW